ncbi:ACT domain-containing protein [Rhodoferax sp.]|uniref:glycine cleavage system protein R n=1 Tax=Rhodoferax sp. TaxID=50421 RepID=UPI001ED77BDA|nr:ACT domain-containing protein [Rhodoferax sp.]MBT9507594.1 cellulose-binding protein [Rhodoferax sp.]
MTTTMVFTFVGADKPGLVEQLAQTVSKHGGNWLESRMSELAGQFAGIVQVAVSEAQQPALRAALTALSGKDLTIVVAVAEPRGADKEDCRNLRLSIIGNDRPGIVREVAMALAARHINVREMDTTISSAPMSGAPMFEAVASIQVPRTLDMAELNDQLDAVANALTVDIDLEESLR